MFHLIIHREPPAVLFSFSLGRDDRARPPRDNSSISQMPAVIAANLSTTRRVSIACSKSWTSVDAADRARDDGDVPKTGPRAGSTIVANHASTMWPTPAIRSGTD